MTWTPSTCGETYRLRLGTSYTWAAVWLEAPRPGREPRWRASVIGKTLGARFDSAEQAQRAAERELAAALAEVRHQVVDILRGLNLGERRAKFWD